MLMARLKHHLLPRLSTRQYGFMPQRSTEDSLYTLIQRIRGQLNLKRIVVLISLDIEGAFDSAWWPMIRVRLAEEQCPLGLRRVIGSYLSNRRVRVRYAGEQFEKQNNKGCVQGSIGGPILWNLLIDPLLKALSNEDIHVQAFADDVVLVVDGDTALEIESKANPILRRVQAWGVSNKLKFAPHKTNAMTITRRLKYDVPRLNMGGVAIKMVREIKVLGVTIDDKLTFNTHVANVCIKAAGIYKQLTRAAKVSWGLTPEVTKIIYTATIEPIVLYAASAWAPAANKKGIIKSLGTLQRGIAQKSCKAYRTVSLNSALLLSGMLPLDLRVREAASLYEAKRGAPLEALPGREMERMASALEAPHPASHIDLDFTRLENQEQLSASADPEVKIFTDGSKIEGRVGAALSIWSGASETRALKLALPSYCTVYQAELLAICVATREIRKSKSFTFGIYSDSMAALQTVQNHASLHPLAVEARENLTSLSHQNRVVNLFWIKAHAGLEGNERVDQLAKEAAIASKRRPDYDLCPVSFVKRHIRMETLGEWDRRYRESATASTTKLFFPDAVAAYGTIRKIKLNGVLTQALTGHGGFSEYLARFKCKENPSCACDGITPETVLHLLTDCPIHDKDRHDLQMTAGLTLTTDNIKDLMTNKNRTAVLNFLEKTVRAALRRNKS